MSPPSPVILNVNDDEASRYVTSRVLGLAGFQVVDAGSGSEALALADEHTDLAILDVRLPDISGLEVCRRLKQAPRTRGMLVLHLSAQAVGPGDRAHGLEHGADGYLVAPVDPEELVAQVHALLRLRRAEREVHALSREVERQRRLLDMAMASAADPIALFDASGRLLFANQAAHAARGSHEVLVSGESLSAREEKDPSLAPFIRLMEVALSTGQVQRGAITLSTDQGPRHFDYTLSPTLDGDGQVAALMATSRDVTEERSEEEFREQFIGMLGHDLRNPLNALSMSAQQLKRKGNLDERQSSLTERILTSADRMDRMIRQLLDFARSRLGGGVPVVASDCDVFDVARRTLEEMRASHPGRMLMLEVVGDGRGAWDLDRLEQAFSNLLANALKYSPVDSPVRMWGQASAREVVLRVHNGGPPIPSEELPHIFAAWRRGSRAVQHEAAASSGLGLGLYITRQILLAHGGEVTVESSASGGTTFTVRLPR
ncbi:response regulator [Myxococcus sp. CA033]|uniref:sensor histidine kinase n=1 Tax=Myxococcus sp. CA033 TaxID=2741516 RepID=UPI00157B0CAC|nr:ATP-binding protein [Myxococcus sp. CA033]NTX37762.1 response regulator [Myxococcus sp. CA033]